jgi:hypothetical protein
MCTHQQQRLWLILFACLPASSAPLPACLQYSSKRDGEDGAPASADELLICGWMGNTFMWELLAELDHSDQVGLGLGWGWGQCCLCSDPVAV